MHLNEPLNCFHLDQTNYVSFAVRYMIIGMNTDDIIY